MQLNIAAFHGCCVARLNDKINVVFQFWPVYFVQICFCQNFVKFPPILIIFYRKMAKRLELCEMHSFSTSPNSRHHTTVLNADVRNCYTTLKVVICSKLCNDLISAQ